MTVVTESIAANRQILTKESFKKWFKFLSINSVAIVCYYHIIITFYQNQDTWHLHKCWWVKKKWLLHLANLAQTSKTFPNIISKITQHNQLLAKHKIIDLLMVRVTLNEYTSNFESLDWNKHHVPDAFFEIVSQLFYYIFFEFL